MANSSNAYPDSADVKTGQTNAYTPPSYWQIFSGNANAPGNPIGDKNFWNTMGGRVGSALWPGLASQLQFSNTLIPQQQDAVSSMLAALNPSNVAGTIRNFNTASNQAAGQQSNLAGLIARNAGMSSGAQQGAQMNVANQAAQAQNANMQSLLSPQGIANTYAKYLSALQQGMTPAYFPMMMSLASGTPPTTSSGDGWSSLLGSVASLVPGWGTALGAALKGFGSSGSNGLSGISSLGNNTPGYYPGLMG